MKKQKTRRISSCPHLDRQELSSTYDVIMTNIGAIVTYILFHVDAQRGYTAPMHSDFSKISFL